MHTPNNSGLPIVEIPLRDHERIAAVGQLLFDRGVYVTLAAYPLVPREEVGFRVQLTAANTDAEIDTLIAALEELTEMGELRPVEQESAPPVEPASAPPVGHASPQPESVAEQPVPRVRTRRWMRNLSEPWPLPSDLGGDVIVSKT